MTDRINLTCFASFKAEGVKPLPTEPVQVYEDPGAAIISALDELADAGMPYIDYVKPEGQGA